MSHSAVRRKKAETSKAKKYPTAQQLEKIEPHLSRFSTLPKTIRLPELTAFQLDLVAKQLKTNAGKLLNEILEDVLPAFIESDSPAVRIAVIEYYHRLRATNALQKVDYDKLLKKTVLNKPPDSN
jgi:hypothetical protein